MILEFTLGHLDLIADVASKPMHDVATSQLLLKQMEKHRSSRFTSDSQSTNERNINAEDSDFDTSKTFSLFEIYDQCEEPRLNSRETLEYLVNQNYMAPQLLKLEDPLRVLVQEPFIATGSPNLTGFDLTVHVDQDPFEEACENSLRQQKELRNPRAIAPCKGGTLLFKAKDEWNETKRKFWRQRLT